MAETLLDELENFQCRISPAGHTSYRAWSEVTHDDILFAAMLACWHGECLDRLFRRYCDIACNQTKNT